MVTNHKKCTLNPPRSMRLARAILSPKLWPHKCCKTKTERTHGETNVDSNNKPGMTQFQTTSTIILYCTVSNHKTVKKNICFE